MDIWLENWINHIKSNQIILQQNWIRAVHVRRCAVVIIFNHDLMSQTHMIIKRKFRNWQYLSRYDLFLTIFVMQVVEFWVVLYVHIYSSCFRTFSVRRKRVQCIIVANKYLILMGNLEGKKNIETKQNNYSCIQFRRKRCRNAIIFPNEN